MVEKERCCGCSACYNICPQRCITMQEDSEGFLYPCADFNKCIHCGMCDAVCPAIHKSEEFSKVPFAWGGYINNDHIRRTSSSGGIFSAIAESVIDEMGIVFGAAFTSDFSGVRHVGVESKEDLYKLRGSKYLQSDLENCFIKIRTELNRGRKVLFSGTFCQVDGLHLFLGKNYDNLLTVELICHGAPSPKVFKKYLCEMKQKLGGEIKRIAFRDEVGGSTLIMKIDTTTQSYRADMNEDPYYCLFMSNLCLRPSCYHCPSKGKNRRADITLADFWGVEKASPDLVDGGGVSLTILHSEKGLNTFKTIKGKINGHAVEFGTAINGNKAFFTSYSEPALRESFWKDFNRFSIDKLKFRYCGGNKKRLKRMLAKLHLLEIAKKGKVLLHGRTH